jgi:AraC-like DNA-binding protein
MAEFYLRHSHFNLKHVTHLLGFHDHSSFHKACTRWFGMTPGQYRTHESLPVLKDVVPVLPMSAIGRSGDHKIPGFARDYVERMHR